MYMCIGIPILLLSMILDFGTVPSMWYFSFFTLSLEIYLIELPGLLRLNCSLKTFTYKSLFPLLGLWLMIFTDK